MRTAVFLLFFAAFCQVVQAEVLTVDVTVKAVDVDGRSITVAKISKTPAKDLELDISKKAEILVDGKAASLDTIQPGQQISLSYETGLEIVTKIVSGIDPEAALQELLLPMQGTWLAVAEENGGKRLKREDLLQKRKVLTIEGTKFTLSTANYNITGKIAHVPDEGANAIDVAGKFLLTRSSRENDVVLKSIFEVQNETLKLCYSMSDHAQENERPTKFNTEEGKKGISITFKKME